MPQAFLAATPASLVRRRRRRLSKDCVERVIEHAPFLRSQATVKAAVGPAVLYMPKGFQEGGLGFSLGMLMLSYFLFALGATRLLECKTRMPASSKEPLVFLSSRRQRGPLERLVCARAAEGSRRHESPLSHLRFALQTRRADKNVGWKMAESRNRKTSYAGMMGKAFGPHGTALVRFTIVAQQCGICASTRRPTTVSSYNSVGGLRLVETVSDFGHLRVF